MADKGVHIVGHNDLDGLGAHALMEKRFNDRGAVHHFIDYSNMEDVFSKIVGLKNSEIVFVDVSVTGNAERIAELFGKLSENGNVVSLYDHHDISRKEIETLSEVLDELVLNKGICTTEIIQRRYFPYGEKEKRLAEVAHSSDFESNRNDSERCKMATRLDDVIAYANVQDGKNKTDSIKSKIVEKLAAGATVESDGELAEFYFLYQPIKRKALGQLDGSVTYLQVDGHRAAFAIFPEELAKKPAIMRLKEKTSRNADVFVGIAPSGRLSVNVSGNVPEECFRKLVEPFNGGGRYPMGGGQLKYHETIGDPDYEKAFGLIAKKMGDSLAGCGRSLPARS